MFSPKLSVVTGGGSGIGAEMAKQLAARGGRVIVADINLQNAQRVQQNLGAACEAVHLDVTDLNAVKQVFTDLTARHGALDCLVNCAGVNFYGEALQTPAAEWLRVLSVNLNGTVLTSLAAYEIMAKQGQGAIINMGSMSMFLVDPMFGAYVTSKFGVVGFSRGLAVEGRAYGVNVSVVCPGNIVTPMKGDAYELSRFTPAMPVDKAVRIILRGAEKRQRVIVFPFRSLIIWWLERLSPNILNPIRNEIFRRAMRRIGPNH